MITPLEAKKELARRELAKRGIDPANPPPKLSGGQRAYNFAQETVPYLAGAGAGVLGAGAGGPLGEATGPVAAGLGYAGAKSGLRGIGRYLGYEKPSTLGQETSQTALRDLPMGTAMEATPSAIKNLLATQPVRSAGKAAADIFGSIPGVDTKDIVAMFKNPRRLLPPFLGGPPALKEAGETLGKVESKYGIGGLEEREGSQVLKVKSPTGMKEGTVRIQDPSRAFDPKVLEAMQAKGNRPGMQEAIDQLKALGTGGPKETERQVAARVFDEMKQGKLPDLNDTVKAIRGIDNRLEQMGQDLTTEESQNKLLLSQTRKKLVNHLSEMAPDLKSARTDYAMGKTRQAFTSPAAGLLAQSGGKDVSRMGANRLVGPFALTRIASNPAFAALLGATQSPLVLGGATAGLGGLTQAAQSRITPYLIQSLLETIRRRKPMQEGKDLGNP